MKRIGEDKSLLILGCCLAVALMVCFVGLVNNFTYYVVMLLSMFVSLLFLIDAIAELMDCERAYANKIIYLLAATVCCVALLFFLLYFPLEDSSYGFAQLLLGESAVTGDQAIAFASIIFATSSLLVSAVQPKMAALKISISRDLSVDDVSMYSGITDVCDDDLR